MKIKNIAIVTLFFLVLSGCTIISNLTKTGFNTKLNDAQTTEDSMAKLEAQGCSMDKLDLIRITKIANQQYVEYGCVTKHNTTIRIFKINDDWFILGE